MRILQIIREYNENFNEFYSICRVRSIRIIYLRVNYNKKIAKETAKNIAAITIVA
jgi:hypothetical protein